MINAYKASVKSAGSCNFCNRGTLYNGGKSILRPYRKVWVVGSDHANGGVVVRMCSDCAKTLRDITK
jgi:hypothetical protein